MQKKVFGLIAVLMCSVQLHAFSINVDPPSIQTKAKPGEHVSAKIMVENTSKEPILVKVYAQDWKYKEGMQKQFLDLGQTPYSLNKAITLYVKDLTIPAKGRKEVALDIQSPSNKSGGLYGVVFFESAPVQANRSSTVRIIGRIGTIIYHEIEGTQQYQFDIALQKMDRKNKAASFYFNLTNQSNVHLDLQGSLLILNSKRDVVDRIPISVKALPKEKQSFEVVSHKEFSGDTYTGLFTLTYSENKEPYSKTITLIK